MESKRIAWVDYFKAITMILVVVGHSTGMFAGYIYQFHVAAFFVISGFVSRLEKKKLDELVINRIFTIILPYTFVAVLGTVLFWILDYFQLLSYVSTYQHVLPLKEGVEMIYSWLQCDWLGACWFIVALFGGTIISKILLLIAGNRVGFLYVILSFFLFIQSYKWNTLTYFSNKVSIVITFAVSLMIIILCSWLFDYFCGKVTQKFLEKFENLVE